MAIDALACLRSIVLAQAHECVIAKAVRESNKAATIAGVATYVRNHELAEETGDYYP